jgi:hypothetical protein
MEEPMIILQKVATASSGCLYRHLTAARVFVLGIVSLTALVATPVEAGTVEIFSISFTGEKTEYPSGITSPIYGSGSFSIDVGGSICVETIPDGCNPVMPWYPSTIFYNPVIAISVSVAEQLYSSMSPGWWASGSQPPGQAGSEPYSVYSNTWFLGDPYWGTQQLSIDFIGYDAVSAYGTWSEMIAASHSPNGQSYNASGTWTASMNSAVVPIPASAYLLFSGILGMLGFMGRSR